MANPIVLDLNKNAPANILNLTKALPLLLNIRGEMNWDEAVVGAENDLDIFIYCLNEHGKITSGNDVIFFNNKYSADGAIAIPVDNTTGGGEDDEHFTMALDKLSAQHVEWHIYMFIHKAAERGQNFGQIRNARFELLNGDTGESMVHYQVTQTFSTETALHVASVIRNANGEYEVHPVGDAGCMDPNQVAGAYM